MAIEKILNTRIQLKYDTLANWSSSTFILKAGELAIVSLGETKDGTVAGDVNQHPVLFKVGDGNHTFAQLPYASALAADVYAWAKASDVKLEGKTIKFVGTNKEIAIPYITESEATTLINNALKAYSTTEQMNAAIKVETDRAVEAEGALDDKIDGVAGRVTTLEGHVGDTTKGLLKDVADLKTAVGDGGSVATKIESAINALDSEKSQAAGVDGLALSITQVDGKITTISGSIAAETYDAYGAAAAAQAAAATDATNKANSAQAAAATDATNKANAAKDAANTYTDGEIDKVEATIEKVVDGTTPVAKATNADQLGGTAAANYALKTYVDQAETDAVNTAKTYADNIKKEILTGDSTTELKDAYDTLVEIQTWIEGAGVDATELTEAIAAEAGTRASEITRVEGLVTTEAGTRASEITRVEGLITAETSRADTAEKANAKAISDEAARAKAAEEALEESIQALGITDGKVANAANADMAAKADSLTDNAKAEVKGVKVDNATNADNLGGTAAANYALKTYVDQAETDAVNTAKGYTDAREVEIKKYADQAEADAIAAANQYTDNLAGNYATAAQGAKADSALQSIEVGTGLKVSAKASNKQTIEIDDTVIFVFDCGSASRNIENATA